MIDESVKKHFNKKVFEDDIININPYIYSIIDNVFPNDFYLKIIENLPSNEEFIESSNDVYKNRGRIWLGHNPSGKCKNNTCVSCIDGKKCKMTNPFLIDLFSWLISDDMVKRWINKYNKYITNVGKKYHMNGTLNQDSMGYSIGPHLDSRSKSITMLIYLPPDDKISKYGTSINIPKTSFNIKSAKQKNEHYNFDDFDEIKMVEFIPNRILAFVVDNNSWHSVKYINDDIIRNSIQLNISFNHKY